MEFENKPPLARFVFLPADSRGPVFLLATRVNLTEGHLFAGKFQRYVKQITMSKLQQYGTFIRTSKSCSEIFIAKEYETEKLQRLSNIFGQKYTSG